MKSRLPFSLFSALLGAASAFAPAARGAERIEELAKMLPQSASLIFCVKSNPELIKDWDASGIGRFMECDEAKKWMAPMYDKDGESKWNQSAKEESGMSFRESISVNPGATAVGFDFTPMIAGDSKEPVVVEISDMAGKEKEVDDAFARKLEAKKKKQYPNAVLKTIDIAGVKTTVLAADEGEKAKWLVASAIVDGVQIESRDRDAIERAIASVKSGGDAAKKAEQLARVAEINGGTSDVTVLADLESLIAVMQKKMTESQGKSAGPLGAPEQMILSVLGLEELKGLALTLDLTDERSSGNFILLHTEKPQGIIPMMMRGTSTEVPQPEFLPGGADQASCSRQSFANIYDALMAAVQKLGPMSAMVTMQLDQMEQKVGLSLRKDLFGSMDDVMAQAQTLKSGANGLPEVSQVTAIKLKDHARFQAALNAVLAIAGNGFGVFEETEIEGQKVHTLKPSLAGGADAPGASPNASQIAYAVTDDYLLFSQGSTDMLQKVLARLKSKAADGSIWEAPASQAAIAALPKGYTGMAVSNGATLLKTMATMFGQLQNMAGGAVGPKAATPRKGPKGAKPGEKPAGGAAAKPAASGPTFDPKAVPGDDVFARYFGVSASGNYSEPDATVVKFIALPVGAK